MDAMTWYAKTTGTDTINAVASKAGLIYTTLSRQLRAKNLSAETVVAIARAYGRDTLDALVAHGLITQDDLRRHGLHTTLSDATDAEIADEVWRRLSTGEDHAEFDKPVGQSGPGLHAIDGGQVIEDHTSTRKPPRKAAAKKGRAQDQAPSDNA